MGEKNHLYRYPSNENAASGTGGPNNECFELTRLETLILGCTKSKPKSEAKISREVKINLPIVSQVITDLMLKGLMERTRRRRILLANKEYFSTSLEGLIALERAHRNTMNYTFFSQLNGFYSFEACCRLIKASMSNGKVCLDKVGESDT